MTAPKIEKIVSGGQTGVDRAALDVALALEIPHGGWCPRGRRAEDGAISNVYQLTQTPSASYVVRTEKNVLDSDGTLILFRHRMSRGTALTASFTRRHSKPCLSIDLAAMQGDDAKLWDDAADAADAAVDDESIDLALSSWLSHRAAEIHRWMVQENVRIVNVAGPRESTNAGIAQDAYRFLFETLIDVIAE